MEIRVATEQDREGIAEVYTDAFFEDWKQLSHDKKKIARALKNGHILNNYVVAISDDKIIAFLALVIDDTRAFNVPIKDFKKVFGFFKGYMVGMALKNDMERVISLDPNTAYIDIIGVSKKYQRKGIASELLDYLFHNYDYSSFLLSVTDVNVNAIECYIKNGFKEIKREKIKYAKQRGFSEYIYLMYRKEK